MIELFWKRMSLFSLRLIWKMSLQMLSRLFPLTHSWRGKCKTTSANFCIKCPKVPWMPLWLWLRGRHADTHTPEQTPTTHSEAELCDVQVELGRVEVDEAEQRSKYPRPPLTASAEHVRFCQGAMETFTQITQAVHRALRAAWHHGKADIAKKQTTNMSSSGQHVRHSQKSKHPKMKTLTCVCWQVCIHVNTDE